MASTGTGHVFAFRGDLDRLACDAVLVPTDLQLHITRHWLHYLPDCELQEAGRWWRVRMAPPPEWGAGCRAFRVGGDGVGRPVWLVQTADDRDRSARWVAECQPSRISLIEPRFRHVIP